MATVQPIQVDDSTTKQGLCQDIDFTCGSTVTTFPKLDKIRSLNFGLDEVADLIEKVSGTWNWEDAGQTDLPIGTTDLVENQADYTIDTSFLSILGVYIKDASGNYKEIQPIDRREIIENDTDDVGTPSGYYISGNSIYLNPIPDSTVTTAGNKGLKVHFKRNVKYFATDATTALAGYNPQFYKLASLYASRDFAIAKGKSNLNVILSRIEKMEAALKSSYARRNRTTNKRVSVGLDLSEFE